MPSSTPEKNREYQKLWYSKNSAKRREQVAARKREITRWFIDYKSNLSCTTCGESHPACIDFHHRDPSNKHLALSTAAYKGSRSKETLLLEIAKCDVLCANCHRKLHWDMKQ